MDPNTQRAEAERWLGIAVKLLTTRDFLGSKTFAIRARESDPNNGISDQILAVVDTVLAGERRLSTSQQPDWYAVLQLPRLVRDPELIANHYRRLAMLLNPDHNRLPFADYALQLAMEGWSVLSDPTKKWLFDNDLAMSLQRPDPAPARVDPVRVDHGSAPGGSGAATGGASTQLNTFQFFQPQPPQPPTQQSPPPMWQQQQQPQQQQPQQPQPQQQQHIQREFMSPPPMSMSTSSLPPPPFQQAQQLPPQWQIRDPTPVKVRGAAVVSTSSTSVAPLPPPQPPQNAQPAPVAVPVTTGWVVPEPARGQVMPPAPATLPPVAPTPSRGSARVTYTTVDDGNASDTNNDGNGNARNTNNDDNDNASNTNNDDNGNPSPAPPTAPATENHCGDEVVEEVDKFWTACPYCLYIYEYKKMYQDCTLRCQNCRRAFHAAQIPNPPPIECGGGDGKDKEKEEKQKDSSFCCWGFFPLGFSMAAWKKHNQSMNPNGSSNWVPFSPMFNVPTENGDGNFHWFASSGGGGGAKTGATRKKHVGRQRGLGNDSAPRVYVDDAAYIDLSEPSDSYSSDRDWRNQYTKKHNPSKKKVVNKGSSGTGKRGRPRKVFPGTQNLTRGGGVSVGGEDLEDGSEGQVVVGLVAATRTDTRKNVDTRKNMDTRKNVANPLPRKQTRRTVKDMGRLDLNVEFNNEGEDHAPAVRAVNGEEDGIETIGFFEGLDEFLSTLPILNVGGDEKPKPS